LAGIVETELVFFSGAVGSTACDAVDDWAGTSLALDTELKIQGTGCLGIKVSNSTGLAVFTISGTVNLSSTMLYLWAMFADPLARLGTKAGGGFGVRIESAASDYIEWYIAGKDTWSGGWKAFAQHTDAPGDDIGGSIDKTQINKVSIRWTTTNSAKVTPNCYFDAIRFGKYLRIRGGDVGSPATFDDLISAEENSDNKYGILERTSGVLFAQGNLEFGSPGTFSTYFRDVTEVIVFKELPNTLPIDYYEVKVQGNSVATTTVYFGDEIGDSGISGCAFRTAGDPLFKFIANDQYISTLGIYGCSIFDANTISLVDTYSSAYEVENTNFEACKVVEAKDCKFLSVNFISADDIAVELELTHHITSSNFINNPTAVSVASPGTLTLDACFFSGNSIDIEFLGSAGQTLTVLKTNGSDPSSTYTPNGGTVYFAPSVVDLKVYVKDEDGNNLNGIRVAIFTSPGLVELMNEETVDGLATESFSYVSPEDITVRVRKQGYVPVNQSSQIGEAGLLVYITLSDDPVYSPS